MIIVSGWLATRSALGGAAASLSRFFASAEITLKAAITPLKQSNTGEPLDNKVAQVGSQGSPAVTAGPHPMFDNKDSHQLVARLRRGTLLAVTGQMLTSSRTKCHLHGVQPFSNGHLHSEAQRPLR